MSRLGPGFLGLLAAEADRIGGKDGDKFYAQAVGYQSKMCGNILKESAISWRRAREKTTSREFAPGLIPTDSPRAAVRR